MESNPARLYIPDPKDDKDAIRWRLDSIALCEDQFGTGMVDSLEKAIAKAMKNELTSKDIQFWSGIADSDKCEIDEVDYAVLYFATRLFESPEITEKQIIDIYSPAKQVIDAKIKLKKLRSKISVSQTIDLGKDKLEHTRICIRKFLLPTIRAKLALLELMALLIPDKSIPKLVDLTSDYLSCVYVRDWAKSLRYDRLFGNANEKENAKIVLKQFSRAIEGDAREIKIRNYRYWFLDRYYTSLSKGILEYRKALATKDKVRQKISWKILNIFPIPANYYESLSAKRPKPKPLALAIMTALDLIQDSKSFLNFQPTISRLKKKHQLDAFIGPSGLTPLLKKYLDHPTVSPELIFKDNIFSVLETL